MSEEPSAWRGIVAKALTAEHRLGHSFKRECPACLADARTTFLCGCLRNGFRLYVTHAKKRDGEKETSP